MSERKINLEEILANISEEFKVAVNYKRQEKCLITGKDAIEFAKEACRQVLELAAENAEIATELKRNLITNDIDIVRSINKDSILNTINQIV